MGDELGWAKLEVNGMGVVEQGNQDGYPELLEELKGRIQVARVKAALAVNAELVRLYWGIGRDIIRKQEEQGWGAKVMERLSEDLRRAFPGMKGLSVRNLKYMRDLAKAWSGDPNGQQLVAQLPWGHNILVIQKVKERVEREWYIRASGSFCVEARIAPWRSIPCVTWPSRSGFRNINSRELFPMNSLVCCRPLRNWRSG